MPYFQYHKFIYIILFLTINFYIIATWNWLIAEWNENSIFYAPNVTKIFLIFIFLLYFVLRAFIIPIRKKIFGFLFPLSFLLIFLLSFILDIIKTSIFVKNFISRIFTYLNFNK